MKMGKTSGHDEVTTGMKQFMIDERRNELLDIINEAKCEKKEPFVWQVGALHQENQSEFRI